MISNRQLFIYVTISLLGFYSLGQEVNNFGPAALDDLIQTNKVVSVDQFVKVLPKSFKSFNFTKVHFSMSLQLAPRILMFNNQMVFSINGAGHSIEGIAYDPNLKFPTMFRYEFDELERFVPKRENNPKACTGCHGVGNEARFIIGERNSWPGISGSGNGSLSNLDLEGAKSFKKYSRFSQFKGDGNIILSGLFFQIASFNERRFTELTLEAMSNNSHLNSYKYAILGSLACIKGFASADNPNPENEILEFIPVTLISELMPTLPEQQLRSHSYIEINIANKLAVSKFLEKSYGVPDNVSHRGLSGDTMPRTTAFRYLMEANGVDLINWSTEFPPHNGIIGGLRGSESLIVPRMLNSEGEKTLLALWKSDESSFCKSLKEKSLKSLESISKK